MSIYSVYVIKELLVETISYHYAPIRMVKSKRLTTPNAHSLLIATLKVWQCLTKLTMLILALCPAIMPLYIDPNELKKLYKNYTRA